MASASHHGRSLYAAIIGAVAALSLSTIACAQDGMTDRAGGPTVPNPTTSPAAPTQSPIRDDTIESNTILMRSTFRIEGQSSSGPTVGTCFVLGQPVEGGDPAQILITANHVLSEMSGEFATVHLRKRDAATGKYTAFPWTLRIRNGGSPLWTKHPAGDDVAAMRISLPQEAFSAMPRVMAVGDLATDQSLAQLEIHPGDELTCLGFPCGIGFRESFPILRGGRIASYPITPTSDTRVMLFDFHVFPGNSGGPAYFLSMGRNYSNGGMDLGGKKFFIAGLITEQVVYPRKLEGLNQTIVEREPLSLGVVVHASMIKETIDQLPPPAH